MCNTFTLLQIVGIYLFPSDLESLSNNIFVEIIISSLLWYMNQFYDQYLNWKLMKYVYLFFTIIIWFIGDVSYTFYFIPCYVDGLFWNFFLPFSFEYTHIYNYESVCCHYLKIVGYLFVIWSQQPDVKERVLQQYLEYHGYAERYNSPKPITLE